MYFLSAKDTSSQMDAIVIYRHPADDFTGLKDAEDDTGEAVTGIGDEARLTFDKDSNRYWLLVTKHGLVTFQISGGDREAVLKIAAAVMDAYTAQ